MTIRERIISRIKNKTAKELLAKIPEGYSIKQAEEEKLIGYEDGYFLAIFLSVNWDQIFKEESGIEEAKMQDSRYVNGW